MNCSELRARLVDPASSTQGGHAPVVDHMNECPACRTLARSFGTIERLYRPDPALEPPADLEKRIYDRILNEPSVPTGPRMKRELPASAGTIAGIAVVGILAILGFLFLHAKKTPARPAPTGEKAATIPASPTPSSASSPVSEPVTDTERNAVAPLLPPAFLYTADTLAVLDPFFPQDLSLGPDPLHPFPKFMPGEDTEIVEKVLTWRHTPEAEKVRILQAQAVFEARPQAERDALRQRWDAFTRVGGAETGGLVRLAGRIRDMDPKRLEKLKADLRGLAQIPRARRSSAWRTHPWAKILTGQEITAAEKLWAAQEERD